MRLDISPKLKMAQTTLSDANELLVVQRRNKEKFDKNITILIWQISAQIDCLELNNRLTIWSQHIETDTIIKELSHKRDELLLLLNTKQTKNRWN